MSNAKPMAAMRQMSHWVRVSFKLGVDMVQAFGFSSNTWAQFSQNAQGGNRQPIGAFVLGWDSGSRRLG